MPNNTLMVDQEKILQVNSKITCSWQTTKINQKKPGIYNLTFSYSGSKGSFTCLLGDFPPSKNQTDHIRQGLVDIYTHLGVKIPPDLHLQIVQA